MKKEYGVPHVLNTSHDLVAVVATGRLGVATGGLEAIVVAVVIVVLVDGDGAHINAGLFALEGAKHPISSFLDLLFFWDLLGFSQLLFVGAVFWYIGSKLRKLGKRGYSVLSSLL